jgi:hypothetical protein
MTEPTTVFDADGRLSCPQCAHQQGRPGSELKKAARSFSSVPVLRTRKLYGTGFKKAPGIATGRQAEFSAAYIFDFDRRAASPPITAVISSK